MGVSGVGKSTIGSLVATELSIPFFDGDDYHPEKNRIKMAQGHPLNDEDRYEWLVNLNRLAKEQLEHTSCVIACSALKEQYRELLKKDISAHVKWIQLTGSFEDISARLQQRKDHFMPPSLLQSQFDTLELPANALKIDVRYSPTEITTKIVDELRNKSEFGIIGLGVMGKSLARNLASHKFRLSLFNRHVPGTEENVASNFKAAFSELSEAQAFDELSAFVNSLQAPRKIMLMVNAGKPVDAVVDSLRPLLTENDVIIDGGNSHYKQTKQRIDGLQKHNLHFIGAGVSGGEEGALKGPSIMPGGDYKAYITIQPFLEAIAARDTNGYACCTYIGKDGSGHFTKMVHNGIEYAEMQLLAEIYFILKKSGKDPDQIATILESWKSTVNSYLLEITIDILRKKEGDAWLINKILDRSGNKGTGNWTTIATAELGMPSTMIPTALFARYISSFKEERAEMNTVYSTEFEPITVDYEALRKTYQLARIVNHHQGFALLHQASISYKWNLNTSEIARIWTNGCIIRSALMEDLVDILKTTAQVLLDTQIISIVKSCKSAAAKVISNCILNEISIPCISEALNFLNGYSEKCLPANLIQAQRDYFGAHTYQRIDDTTGKFYHTDWKSH